MRHNQYQDEERLRQHKLKYPVPEKSSKLQKELDEYNKMWDDHWREQTIIMVFFQVATIALFIWVFFFNHSQSQVSDLYSI